MGKHKTLLPASAGMSQYLMTRRNLNDANDISYYFCHAADGIHLEHMAIAAGQRWHIESCFEDAKQNVDLDE